MANEDFGFIPDPVAPKGTTDNFGFVPDPVTTEQANLSEGEKFKILQGNIEGTKEFLAKKYGVPVEKVTAEQLAPVTQKDMVPDFSKPSPIYTAPVPAYKETTTTTTPQELVINKNNTKIKTGITTSDNQTPELGQGFLGKLGRGIEREAIPTVAAIAAAPFAATSGPGAAAAESGAWLAGMQGRKALGYYFGTYKPASVAEEVSLLPGEAKQAIENVIGGRVVGHAIGLGVGVTKNAYRATTEAVAAIQPETKALIKKAPFSYIEQADAAKEQVKAAYDFTNVLKETKDEIAAGMDKPISEFKELELPKVEAAKKELKAAAGEAQRTTLNKLDQQKIEVKKAIDAEISKRGKDVGSIKDLVIQGDISKAPVDLNEPFTLVSRGEEIPIAKGVNQYIDDFMKQKRLRPTGDPSLDVHGYESNIKDVGIGQTKVNQLEDVLQLVKNKGRGQSYEDIISGYAPAAGGEPTTLGSLKAASDRLKSMIDREETPELIKGQGVEYSRKSMSPFGTNLIEIKKAIDSKLYEKVEPLKIANQAYSKALNTVDKANELVFAKKIKPLADIATGEKNTQVEHVFDALNELTPEAKPFLADVKKYYYQSIELKDKVKELGAQIDNEYSKKLQGLESNKEVVFNAIKKQKELNDRIKTTNEQTIKGLREAKKLIVSKWEAAYLLGGAASLAYGHPSGAVGALGITILRAPKFAMKAIANQEKNEIVSGIIDKLPIGNLAARGRALEGLSPLEELGIENLVPKLEQAHTYETLLGLNNDKITMSINKQKQLMKDWAVKQNEIETQLKRKVSNKEAFDQIIKKPLYQMASDLLITNPGGQNAPIRK